MTFKSIMSHFQQKDVAERLSDYHNTPVQDQHLYYSYESPVHVHTHVASPKHHHGGGGKKTNAAMSALTLLAFLFFLNILQQCLREQTQQFNNPPITVMTAREEFDHFAKMAESKKMDKSGRKPTENANSKTHIKELADKYDENVHSNEQFNVNNPFKKIETVEAKRNNKNDGNQQYKNRNIYTRNATIFKEFIKNKYNSK